MRTLLAGGTLFDGTGAPPAPADVVIEGGRIVDVGTGLDGDEVVDCRGRAVLPGLFDCHVHVTVNGVDRLALLGAPFSLQFYEAARNLGATLAAGITTVRDAGGADLGIKVAQQRGLVAGPRMQISISMISQTGGHGDAWEASGSCLPWFVPHPGRPDGIADGAEGVRRKVREVMRAGADVIKVATSGGVLSPRDDPRHGHLRDAEVTVIVEEAAAAGLRVMSHAAGTDGIKTALRNGVRSIEHGIWLDDEAIEMMIERGAWLVPTLMAPRGVIAAAEAGASLDDHMVDKAKMVVEAHDDSFRRAIAAGVQVAMGTDSGVSPHGRNLEELELMAGLGMRPEQVLHATTLSAARLMDLHGELGSVEPGKRADIVIADGDPLDLRALADRVRAVYQDGRLVHERAEAVEATAPA